MSKNEPLKPTGAMGAPPPGAPQQVSQPISPELRAQQLAQARANEKTLAPLTYGQQPPKTSAEDFFEVPSATAESTAAAVAPGGLVEAARQRHEERPAGYQPAASATDSPSRGVPQPIDDPNKTITGGFGDIGEAEYFPLSGNEIRDLILLKMDEIVKQMENDLRLSMAVTYPRAKVTVEVIVEAFEDDNQTVTIRKVATPAGNLPLEVARSLAKECVFVLSAEHIEMTPEGESVTPPNAVRQAIGAVAPRKQRMGSIVADMPV